MKRKKFLFLVFIFITVLLSFTKTNARNGLTIKQMFDLESVAEVAISPQGKYIAYTLSVNRPFTDQPGSVYRELYLYNTETGETIPFITGNKQIISLGWTPDGSAVTFRANFDDLPGVQVYGISIKGGEAYPITEHTSNVLSYQFINDEELAITAMSEKDPLMERQEKMGITVEVYEEEYRHINLYRYNLDTHQAKQLTKDQTVFDFELSPDGKYAAAAIAPQNLVDDSYMFKRIHLVDMETGETNLIMENPGKLTQLAWSPDGQKIAFQAASKLEDAVSGSLFVIELPSEKKFDELRNYVEGMELSVIEIGWKDDNTLLYAAEESVDISLSSHELGAEERVVLIEPGTLVFRSFDFQNGMVALSANTTQHPNELFTLPLSSEKTSRSRNSRRVIGESVKPSRKTFHNDWLKEIKLARQEKISWDARDGMRTDGVLYYPLNYEEGKRYPLITYIHGGPEAAVQNGWNTRYSTWGQVAAARDFFVFMPNYRASSGRGVDYTMAGYGDLLGVEYNDVLDGIYYLIEKGYVDSEKVGIGGGSYGGYFSAWSATKHSERFAAAVIFVGVTNQVSKRNTTDIPWEDYHVHWGFWTHENWEDVYDRSPVKYAKGSTTPALILHGDSDSRVNPSQSLELYRNLKMHGEAPVRLIWYEGEGHGNRKNVHQLDYMLRTLEWFDHYLKSDNPKQSMPEKYPVMEWRERYNQ